MMAEEELESPIVPLDLWESVCKFLDPLDATSLDTVCKFFSVKQVTYLSH